MKDCILLKKKEYNELVEKANSKKPDFLNITLSYRSSYYGRYINESSNLEFSNKLITQIQRLSYNLLSKLRKEEDEIKKDVQDEFVMELKNLSRRELYKYIKNY